MDYLLFNSWSSLLRVLFLGIFSYIALVVILHVSGKRTLSKLNAFDLVITVSLGSTLATILLSKSVTLTDGVLALSLLVFLQFAVTWTSVRFPVFQQVVKARPRLLFYKGQFLEDAMKRERIAREEVLSAMRGEGYGDPAAVGAVVLETDGTLSIIKTLSGPDVGTLANVSK